MRYDATPHSLRYLDNPTTVSISTTTARNSSALDPGWYEISADVDMFFRQGDSSVEATTSSIPLWAKEYKLIRVRGTTSVDGFAADDHVAGIVSSGSGTLYITKLTQ